MQTEQFMCMICIVPKIQLSFLLFLIYSCKFYMQLQFSASLGVGLQYDKHEKLRYNIRGKKSFPVTTDGQLSFNIKGQCDADKELRQVSITLSFEKAKFFIEICLWT